MLNKLIMLFNMANIYKKRTHRPVNFSNGWFPDVYC